ncbi:MAG: hypothetical protein UV63_C0061G0004 [Microgenomates group bacterium GW2011_GWC1_43_11]|uniref:Uncharacterized protein n=2 Tax=Candidatus Gottesmaniibacteriota TaxID=1752720 RepID=A0A0G1LE59_9BACT|nr:MAG: hypothetical protein UV63_C0061G0004 [Microgenomates group bacterium GW2011_GWC1_43_11]KKT36268.1 MAG: hypothetical protein UW22_C0041G0011 [Candidatus Gottesmanbacteria bacterium GW2011_GWB1_44_11c]KKT58119.1 MAG: hypothetical protein UW52_C0064G0002 [Candidatus Gottesmanbacteria bacterium GW2011_GWA1_44_24b]HCM82805.1 hypothetical protein [Patescibacteria group bacterium]
MPSRTKFTLGDLRLVHSEKNDGPITGFIHTLVRDPKNGTNFEYKDIHISNFEIEPGQVKPLTVGGEEINVIHFTSAPEEKPLDTPGGMKG